MELQEQNSYCYPIQSKCYICLHLWCYVTSWCKITAGKYWIYMYKYTYSWYITATCRSHRRLEWPWTLDLL